MQCGWAYNPVRFRSTAYFGMEVRNKREVKEMDISQEKLDWLKSIGAKRFERPMTWTANHGTELYSDEYIAETPLEVLKAKYVE